MASSNASMNCYTGPSRVPYGPAGSQAGASGSGNAIANLANGIIRPFWKPTGDASDQKLAQDDRQIAWDKRTIYQDKIMFRRDAVTYSLAQMNNDQAGAAKAMQSLKTDLDQLKQDRGTLRDDEVQRVNDAYADATEDDLNPDPVSQPPMGIPRDFPPYNVGPRYLLDNVVPGRRDPEAVDASATASPAPAGQVGSDPGFNDDLNSLATSEAASPSATAPQTSGTVSSVDTPDPSDNIG